MYMVEKRIINSIFMITLLCMLMILCIASQDPKEIVNILKSKYNLKVKGDSPLTYHLGADYFQVPDGDNGISTKEIH